MANRTVYLAEAGVKNGPTHFEALRIEEWEAEKKLEEWREDCKNTEEWWFNVSELRATL